jgi:precorrin-3B synthase
MLTGDGLLVRFMPTDRIGLNELHALCAAARRHGNGTIEITARGSLQVRGLSPRSAPEFAREVSNLGMAGADGINVITDPLADNPEPIIDALAVADEVRRALAQVRLELSAKVSVIVDGGSRLHLDQLPADIRLRAIESPQTALLHVSMGGNAASATPLGAIVPRSAATVVIALLDAIGAHGPDARAGDAVRREGSKSLRARIAEHLQCVPDPPPRAPAEVIGQHPLRGGSIALGVAPAFGHIHADALAELAQAAGRYGVQFAQLAPARALLLLGVAPRDATALAEEAARVGLIVSPDDPRRVIVACPGKPDCTSGLIPARALARELSQHLQWPHAYAPGDGRAIVHISGCTKGCAHPSPAPLTVVGTERGCGIVHHGSARHAPSCHVDPADLTAEIKRLTPQTKESADA